MAKVFGILGQASPSGGVLTTVYTVPTGKHATVKVQVCNRGVDSSFKVALATGAGAIQNQNYIAYDKPIANNDAVSSSAVTITAGSTVRVEGASANFSFTVTGIEDDN